MFYFVIDLVLLVLIIYFSIYFYKNKLYIKLFEYFKTFLFLFLAAKLSSHTAFFLTKFYIIKADSYFIALLIAFTFNLFILYKVFKFIFKFTYKYFSKEKIKIITAKVLSFIEVFILVTFLYFISMQFYVSKKFLIKSINKSYSYKHIKNFYTSFLNKEFTSMILNLDTNTNHKEVIFKSIKNSF